MLAKKAADTSQSPSRHIKPTKLSQIPLVAPKSNRNNLVEFSNNNSPVPCLSSRPLKAWAVYSRRRWGILNHSTLTTAPGLSIKIAPEEFWLVHRISLICEQQQWAEITSKVPLPIGQAVGYTTAEAALAGSHPALQLITKTVRRLRCYKAIRPHYCSNSHLIISWSSCASHKFRPCAR